MSVKTDVEAGPHPSRQTGEGRHGTTYREPRKQIFSSSEDNTFGPLASRAAPAVPRRKPWPVRRIVSPLVLDAVCDCPECEENARMTARAESCRLLCDGCITSPTGVCYPCAADEAHEEGDL